MADSKQIWKDVCWYLIALVVTVLYMTTNYYSGTPRWGAALFALAYFTGVLSIISVEKVDCSLGAVGYALAAMPAIGHAMSENPYQEKYFSLLLKMYVIGFVLVAIAWGTRHGMDWYDARKEGRSSE